MTSETDEQFVERISRAIYDNNSTHKDADLIRLFDLARRGVAETDQHAIGFREGAAHMHKAQADRIAQLEAALREIEYLDRPQVRGLPRRVSIQEIARAALEASDDQ